jgi:hypothetical protein
MLSAARLVPAPMIGLPALGTPLAELTFRLETFWPWESPEHPDCHAARVLYPVAPHCQGEFPLVPIEP